VDKWLESIPPENMSPDCEHLGKLGLTESDKVVCSNCGKVFSTEDLYNLVKQLTTNLSEARQDLNRSQRYATYLEEELRFTSSELERVESKKGKLRKKVRKLEEWKSKALENSRCWYCDEPLGPDDDNHWEHCSEHPARVRVEELEQENKFLERKLKVSYVNERDFENLTGENEELRLKLAELELSQCDCESLRDNICWWTKQCNLWKNKYEQRYADYEALRLENIQLKLELADESKCCSNCAKRDWCEIKLVAKRVFLREADEFCCSVREPIET
jgi:hypothetical protein